MRIMIVGLIIAALFASVSPAAPPATVTYNLDASQSKFMAHANHHYWTDLSSTSQ